MFFVCLIFIVYEITFRGGPLMNPEAIQLRSDGTEHAPENLSRLSNEFYLYCFQFSHNG